MPIIQSIPANFPAAPSFSRIIIHPMKSKLLMATHRVANKLTNTEAAYIAGLVDGEGSITLTRKHRGNNRHLGLTISSTELQLLQFVLDAAGVGNISNKRACRPNHSNSFAYGVYNRQILQVIEQIYSALAVI